MTPTSRLRHFLALFTVSLSVVILMFATMALVYIIATIGDDSANKNLLLGFFHATAVNTSFYIFQVFMYANVFAILTFDKSDRHIQRKTIFYILLFAALVFGSWMPSPLLATPHQLRPITAQTPTYHMLSLLCAGFFAWASHRLCMKYVKHNFDDTLE